MVSLKSKFIFAIALALLPVLAMASNEVLEWKVENSRKELERPPAYATGERTPFPVKERPVVVQPKFTPQDEALTESQLKAMEAADLLNEIRSVLARDDIFSVDVTNLVVDGVLFGEDGPSVLVDNVWYKEGSVIDVPAMAKESLLALLAELEVLDPSVADVVEGQVEGKVASVKSLTIKIVSVEEDKVTLMDDENQTHVISFIASPY